MRQGCPAHRDGLRHGENARDQGVGGEAEGQGGCRKSVQAEVRHDAGFIRWIADQVLVTVPSRVLLEQLAEEMPSYCKVGMGYNDKINMEARGFIAVTDSTHLLNKLQFQAIFVDEAHHPLPVGLPKGKDLFQFSATHKEDVDYRYSLGEAVEHGVLCDYDLTIPVATEGHPYICLANLLLSQAGRLRRVLAYCNSIAEAKRFQKVLATLGLAAWHMNGTTTLKERARILREFSGKLRKPVHVLVTVQVLGEGVNIPNADTCMFVEPRSSFVSIIQALGRVLRQQPSKPLAHIVLPAIVVPDVPVAATVSDVAAPLSWQDSSSGGPLLASTLRHHQAYDRQAQADAPSATALFGVSGGGGCGGGGPPYQQQERSQRETSRLEEQLQLGNGEVMYGGGHQAAAAPRASHNSLMSDTQSEVRNSAGMEGVSGGGQATRKSNAKEFGLDALNAIRAGGAGNRAVPEPGEFDGAGGGDSSELLKPAGGCHVHRLAEKDFLHHSDALLTDARPGAPNALAELVERLPLGESWNHPAGMGVSPLAAEGFARVPSSRSGAEVSATAALGSSNGYARDRKSDLVETTLHYEPVVASETSRSSDRPRQPRQNVEQNSENWTSALSGSPSRTYRLAASQAGPKTSIKTSRGGLVFESGYADQLDRFLQAISRSDSRFMSKDAKQLQSRLWVTDCRLHQDLSIRHLIQEMALELAQILQQSDPWEVRLQAVERFVSEHSRLPKRYGALPREHALAVWLVTTGMFLKRKQLSATRVQKLLNSSDLLRTRVSKWLDPDMLFKLRCRELGEFVRGHRRLPRRDKRRVEGDVRQYNFLAKALRRNKGNPKRLQLLRQVDPLVEAHVTSTLKKGSRINRKVWAQQLKKLVQTVAATGRIPQRSEKEGANMYTWLNHQRACFDGLPLDLKAKLLGSHPVIASYLNKGKLRGQRHTAAV